jgi:hypothetical protein
MKKTTLFIKFAAIPFLSSFLFFVFSFFDNFPYYRNSKWHSWDFLFDFYYYTNLNDDRAFVAYIILIGLFVSVGFFIKQMIKVFKYSGFPSIKEAKSYYDLAYKIKEKRRLEKVNKDYQLKLAKLEEEKKKYL